MFEIKPELVMDRKKVADSIHGILDKGVELLKKDKFDKDDHSRIKLIRVLGSPLNGAVSMIQQETAQQKIVVILERMKQIGYADEPKQVDKG